MSWNTTKYEKAMKDYLIAKLGESEGEILYTDYESLRNELIKDNFFREIKINEPFLSDHSDRHIMDVQNRAYKLIGDFEGQGLSAIDVYCLALMILFHDVGNIFGRNGHDSIPRIAEVYNQYRTMPQNYGEERRVITSGASAHSGKSRAGCKDTLKYITKDSIKEEEVNLPELSAILRFADELAEGQHRTCSFLIDKGLYDENSMIYHKYASIAEIRVDRALGRIVITYTINVSENFNENEEEQKEIIDLIHFSFYRAIKLDQERRYTKYYSSILLPFKYVTVLYKFEKNYTPLDFDIKPIVFEDKYPVPGVDFVKDPEQAKNEIEKNHPDFILEDIINLLRIAKIEVI
ncbi:MAG: hypothetical protein H6Q14_795 [Bacteroidetes bacterium]|nr:hypothetical protein [Bacteroidota bacterium]